MQVTVTRLEASAACSAPWPTERFRLDVLTTVVDTGSVITVVESDVFERWLGRLRDYRAVARINARLRQIAAFGKLGDTRAVGDSIYELRVHYGPGYRVYLVHAIATAEWIAALAPSALERWAHLPPVEDGAPVVVLLCGGDKGNQKRDIKPRQETGRRLEVNHAW